MLFGLDDYGYFEDSKQSFHGYLNVAIEIGFIVGFLVCSLLFSQLKKISV